MTRNGKLAEKRAAAFIRRECDSGPGQSEAHSAARAIGRRFPNMSPISVSTSVEIVIEAVTALTAPISLVAAPEMIAPVP